MQVESYISMYVHPVVPPSKVAAQGRAARVGVGWPSLGGKLALDY